MTIRAVVFDFDGVLVESERAKTAAFRDIFSRWPEHAEAMSRFHEEHPSAPRRKKVEELARRLGRPDDLALLDRVERELSAAMLDRVGRAAVVNGARELLADLAPRVLVAVASLTPQTDLELLLDRHQLAAHVRMAFGDPPTSKTDAVRHVIERVGGEPQDVVLVGDSPADLQVARESGVRFLRRDSGMPFPSGGPPGLRDLTEVAFELRALNA